MLYDDIKKISFDKITTVEEFKQALGLSDDEFNELIENGYNSTDTDTPEGLRDYRIEIFTKDGARIAFDLTYNDDNSLNSVKAYID